MWKVFIISLAAFGLFSELSSYIAATPAIKLQSQRGIIFPTEGNYDECYLDELRQVKGTCKILTECRAALERWQQLDVRPQTCYFNKFDHYVCCEMEPVEAPPVTEQPANVQRRSEMECASYYTFKISVVRGEPTAPREFPYMAALGWKSNFDNATLYRCGGVLISNKYVLTAAHCVQIGGEFPIVVRLGGVNLTESTTNDVSIKQIIVHPGYNVTSSYNDIALVELAQAVGETPACVWSQHDVEHDDVIALGYGHTRFAGAPSTQLLKAKLKVVSNDVCQGYYTTETQLLQSGLSRTHICAGDPEHLRDTCQGDSGGPIIMKVERDSTYSYVVGITSFGQGCAGEPPSIYTRTSSYIDWIEDIVWPVINIRNTRK